MNIKIENWNGYEIRFVEKEPGDWWAAAVDVAKALDYQKVDSMLRKLLPEQKGTHLMSTLGGSQTLSIISETGIYRAVIRSRKPEAIEFERWIYQIVKTLRMASGLEAFQVFRMVDKTHQREAMKRLCNGLWNPVRIDFIKANTIANKAVSTISGVPKMLKKDQMTPDMLVIRQPILDDTVNLMAANDSFGLGLSVSEKVYEKYLN